jgi:hypothetical protein
LEGDIDREFILDGIRQGFSLIDSDVIIQDIAPAQVPNSRSSQTPESREKVEQAIHEELVSGGYITCSRNPRIISALSAVPKPDGNIRLIHDLSRPRGNSVNSYASKDYCKYESLSHALGQIKPGWFMAVVDLKSAYRAVHIRPSEYELMGLSWCFEGHETPVVMCDTRLPFGARKSPAIFNRLSQAVARIMRKQGHRITCYLDDFWVCGPDFTSCKAAYDTLISLLRGLGFQVNWNKVTDPCQKLCFLGVMIDTKLGYLSLKPEKLTELQQLVQTFTKRKRASRKQLESLAGKLCWASHVIPWGRTHLQPVFALMGTLHEPAHKCRLTSIKTDLQWWATWLQCSFNRRRIWLPSRGLPVFTDASPEAGGAFCLGDWVFTHWAADAPQLATQHINTKELAAVVMAAARWHGIWANHHVVIYTDNQVTEAVLNKGAARNEICLELLKTLASLAVKHNFTISARYIPGQANVLADAISRLYEPSKLLVLGNALNIPLEAIDFQMHMSKQSHGFLCRRWCRGSAT